MTITDLLSHASVLERSHRLAAATAEVERTFRIGQGSGQPRGRGSAWAQWHRAVQEFREAAQDSYQSPMWRQIKAHLSSGDATAREAALVYLEADPWCFRSGYEKAELMIGLSRLTLSDTERTRIRRIVLDLVQKPRRREFPQFARLTASIWDTTLDEQLDELAEGATTRVRDQIAELKKRVANRARSTGNTS